MDKINDLSNQLANLSDKELLTILYDSSKMYSDEAIRNAKIIAEFRGLISNFDDLVFKVITTDGRENEQIHVLTLKDLFLKNLINDESLLFVESKNQWFPLKQVFNTEYWKIEDEEIAILRKKDSSNAINSSTNDLSDGLKNHITETEDVQKNQPANIVNVNNIPSHYSRVGGWLSFFIFLLLVLRPPFGLVGTMAKADYLPTEIAKLLFTVSVVDVGLGVIVGLILLISRSRLAPIIAQIYLVIVLLSSILLPFIANSVLGNKLATKPGDIFASIIVSAPLTIIWLIYFSVSKRVKATYKS